MWRGQGEKGYFHGAPEDWNCVAAALRSETLSALVAPSTPAIPGPTAEQSRLATQLNEMLTADDWRDIAAQHLAIAKEVGDRAWEGRAYANLGIAHQSMRDFSQAIENHTQHLAIAREVGDRAGEDSAYLNLASARSSLGDFSQAIAYYKQCLAIAKEVGDRSACNNLRRAVLALVRDAGGADPGMASGILNALGNVYQALGDFSQAIAYYTQHLAIAKEVGDRAGEGSAGNNLGVALEENGDLLAAARALVQALAALQRVERLGRARRPPRVAV